MQMGTHNNYYRLNQLRATFKQVRSHEKQNMEIKAECSYAIYSPAKPGSPNHFGDMLKSKFKVEWEKGVFESYTKNSKVGVFTVPFPIEDLPEAQRIL